MIAQLKGNLVSHPSFCSRWFRVMSGTFKEVRELVKREFGVLYCDSHLRRILRELEMRCLKPIEQIWRWLKGGSLCQVDEGYRGDEGNHSFTSLDPCSSVEFQNLLCCAVLRLVEQKSCRVQLSPIYSSVFGVHPRL